MNNNIIEYLTNIKNKIKNKEYTQKGEITNKNDIHLIELISRYIVHIYSLQNNNKLYKEFDLLFIPNDLEEYDMTTIDFLDFAQVLAHIKYKLCCEIDDILTKKEINQKYLNSFKLPKLRFFVKKYDKEFNGKKKKDFVDYIFENKDKFFPNLLEI